MNDTPQFDVIIVGSGFGGSVMAHELATAGMRVCLLERGKQYAPGEFARSPYQMSFNTWDPSEGLHGIFNLWRFQDLDAIVASGLGGGSLIYANVLLRKPKEWFNEHWPLQYDQLDDFYRRAEILLDAQPYPVDQAPYSTSRRGQVFDEAIERAAENLGASFKWEELKLAVSFTGRDGVIGPGRLLDDGSNNLHKRPRLTCQLCGECNFGCNYGAKNTLDYTCLSAAQKLGAKIMTRCEVRSFEPIYAAGDKDTIKAYRVWYVDHSNAQAGKRQATYEHNKQDPNDKVLKPQAIIASQLVLAAGSLGTTFLMLKNQGAFPNLGKGLGSRFSSNGDLLTLATRRRHGLSDAEAPPLVDGSFGPVITRSATFLQGLPSQPSGGFSRGFYIQDAGFPYGVDWGLHLLLGNVVQTLKEVALEDLRNLPKRFKDGEPTDVGARLAHIMRLLSEKEWIPLLSIGQDTPNGEITFDGRKAQVSWQAQKSEAYYDDLKKMMGAIAAAMDADIVQPPWPLSRLITVHPLGGCPMGKNANEGVVNRDGQVFRGDRLYDGLFLADGSVMPGPVGANPSLTIAAFALRSAKQVIQNYTDGRRAP